MSVNYLVEINRINDANMTRPIDATAYKLLMTLMHLANRERFPDRLAVSNALLCALVGCSEDVLGRARGRLVKEGWIEHKGRKRFTPVYIIHYVSYHNPESAGYSAGLDTGYSEGLGADTDAGFPVGMNMGLDAGLGADTYINVNYKPNETPKERVVPYAIENWRTSARARGAVAQEIIDKLGLRERLGVSSIHETIAEYLALGMPPAIIEHALMAVCTQEQAAGVLFEKARQLKLAGV